MDRRNIYEVTATSPTTLSPTTLGADVSFGPKTTLVFRDLDGEGKTYTVEGTPLAKIVIESCKNFSLHVLTRLLTSTLELSFSTSISLSFTPPATTADPSLTPHIPSIIQLDPPLTSLSLTLPALPTGHPAPSIIASTVLPVKSTLSHAEAWRDVRLEADGVGGLDLGVVGRAGAEGGEQVVVKLVEQDGLWRWEPMGGLKREGREAGEREGWPVL